MDKKNGKKKKGKNKSSDSSSSEPVVIEKKKDKEKFESSLHLVMKIEKKKKGKNKSSDSSSSDHVEIEKKDKELKNKKRKFENSENPKMEKKNGKKSFHNMKKTLLWLDLENCRVPHDLNPEEVYPRMKKILREDGYGGKLEIKIVMPFTDCKVPEPLLKKMSLVRVRNCPRPKDPKSVDKKDNQIVDDYIEDDNT